MWLDDIISHIKHSSSQEDLKHISLHQTLNPAWIYFNACPIAQGKYNRTSGKWNYESTSLIGLVKIWINVLLKVKKKIVNVIIIFQHLCVRNSHNWFHKSCSLLTFNLISNSILNAFLVEIKFCNILLQKLYIMR